MSQTKGGISERILFVKVPKGPDSEEGRQRLATILRLWDELKAVRHDPEKYYALIERIRREADAFRKMLDADDPKA